jgi:dephospho-CoA kinase
MIICVIGPSCAGKTTSCEIIEERRGVPFFEASDFVEDRYSDSGHSGDIMDFVIEEFQGKGKDTFAKPIAKTLSSIPENDSLICGFRTVEEIKYIEAEFDTVKTFGIYANSLLRYQRKLSRDNPSQDYTYRDFINKDYIEYEFGIMSLLRSNLQSYIINEGTKEQFFDDIESQIIQEFFN